MKRILVSQRVTYETRYEESRDSLSHDLQSLLLEYSPLFFPMPNRLKGNKREYAREVDPSLIILSGGNNISPVLYGSSEAQVDVSRERDETEFALIKFAIENSIPLLGICRGMQMIQVFFNGRLKEVINHVNIPHRVDVRENPFGLRDGEYSVNSFHNMGIPVEQLSDSLTAFGVCKKDSTVEGFYHKEHPIVGMMWHPEREPHRSSDLNKSILHYLLR